MKTLVIVESPGKITKISSFLGKNYVVKASYGIFRDLHPKKMSIDFENNFKPIYIITKPDVAKNLKKAMVGIDMVYLAADADFEGDGIAQSMIDVLKPAKYKRLIFNSITKTAILNAIENAGDIDKNRVSSQKCRRVLDRIFGFKISGILQKQIGGHLSAGRVQSVAVRIIVDRENEIKKFIETNQDSSFFKVRGIFSGLKAVLCRLVGIVVKMYPVDGKNPYFIVIKFMKRCQKSEFIVDSITDNISLRSPAPPFTTSTLQQEAARKLSMSIDCTMKTAQKLYEGGFITYMRTDSVEISEEGHAEIKKVIYDEFGKEYYHKNIYKNKSASSQDAHEACRPTHPELIDLENEIDDKYQIKLYKLIWQRTIASQMKKAKINVTTIGIHISEYKVEKDPFFYFQSQLEKIVFPGFMKVYLESKDEEGDDETIKNFEGKLPKVGDKLKMIEINAKQEYARPPCRYTQASLVKKLETLGIGRPSTFVNTIKTILDREYIKIGDTPGIKKPTMTFTIKTKHNKIVDEIFEHEDTILLGQDKNKIIPTDLGKTVTDFLLEKFSEMMDYKFTAKMEQELDDIANGKKVWHEVVQKFYDKLMPVVDELSAMSNIKRDEKLLGVDDENVKIYVTMAKYGPVVKKQIDDRDIYAKIIEPLTIDTVTLKEAINLFPKLLGKYNKKDIFLKSGQFGYYATYDGDYYSLTDMKKKEITLEKAIEIIEQKKSSQLNSFDIKEGTKTNRAVIINGKFGFYIMVKRGNTKTNYKIPPNMDPKSLTEKMVKQIISVKKVSDKSGSKVSKKVPNKSGSKVSKKVLNKSK